MIDALRYGIALALFIGIALVARAEYLHPLDHGYLTQADAMVTQFRAQALNQSAHDALRARAKTAQR